MSKQTNKVQKRRRRTRYIKRQKSVKRAPASMVAAVPAPAPATPAV